MDPFNLIDVIFHNLKSSSHATKVIMSPDIYKSWEKLISNKSVGAGAVDRKNNKIYGLEVQLDNEESYLRVI